MMIFPGMISRALYPGTHSLIKDIHEMKKSVCIPVYYENIEIAVLNLHDRKWNLIVHVYNLLSTIWHDSTPRRHSKTVGV
jgi:hypothetical protein